MRGLSFRNSKTRYAPILRLQPLQKKKKNCRLIFRQSVGWGGGKVDARNFTRNEEFWNWIGWFATLSWTCGFVLATTRSYSVDQTMIRICLRCPHPNVPTTQRTTVRHQVRSFFFHCIVLVARTVDSRWPLSSTPFAACYFQCRKQFAGLFCPHIQKLARWLMIISRSFNFLSIFRTRAQSVGNLRQNWLFAPDPICPNSKTVSVIVYWHRCPRWMRLGIHG